MKCFICEISGEDAILFSAIVNEGVVPICEDCSLKEDILIIKRVGQLRESERNLTVYERLSHMAGLDPVGHKEKIMREERIELRRQEMKRPAEKKDLSFPNLKQIKPQFEEGLIRNYHWAIFNARRAMKLTQKQLADEIGEPEASVKLIERGLLPDNYPPFIRKLQTYLRITLFNNQLKKDSSLGKDAPKVNEIFSEEEKPRVPYWKRLGFLQKNREKRKAQELEKKENEEQETSGMRKLSQDEIDRITFSEEF